MRSIELKRFKVGLSDLYHGQYHISVLSLTSWKEASMESKSPISDEAIRVRVSRISRIWVRVRDRFKLVMVSN